MFNRVDGEDVEEGLESRNWEGVKASFVRVARRLEVIIVPRKLCL